MNENWRFDSFAEWRSFLWDAVKCFLFGFGKMLLAFVYGLISLIAYAIRQIEAFCKRETIAACIVGSLFVLMASGWIYTFVSERAVAVSAQHMADSLSYDLSKYTQMYEKRTVNIDTTDYDK